MFKLIIAGGREFSDYELLEKEVIKLLRGKYPKDVEIVSGGARGADSLGEKFAKEKGCSLQSFPADWNTYGKSAGYRRNAEMAAYADACICFWDGKSKGTKHMIDLAEKKELLLTIIKY
jgi:hypothetical protein